MTGFVLVLALLAPALCRAQTQFNKAEYLKTASPGQKKGGPVAGTLRFDHEKKELQFVDRHNSEQLSVPYGSVKSMLYERTAKPRYMEAILISPWFMFSKSKKHYLTVQYAETSGTGHFALIHLDKSNFREALAAAESETGQKIERAEEN